MPPLGCSAWTDCLASRTKQDDEPGRVERMKYKIQFSSLKLIIVLCTCTWQLMCAILPAVILQKYCVRQALCRRHTVARCATAVPLYILDCVTLRIRIFNRGISHRSNDRFFCRLLLMPKGFCMHPGYPGKIAEIPCRSEMRFPCPVRNGRLQTYFLGSI